MIRSLSVGDIVYTPCTNFNSGKTRLEEQKVKEIGPDFIVLTHVATLERQGDKLERNEIVEPTDHRGDGRELKYYSRPFKVIMDEYIEENKWICAELLKGN